MDDFRDAIVLALKLIFSGDGTLYAIIALSLWVSGFAVAIAIIVGLPAGAAMAIYPFPARRAVVILVNSLLGLPPVVVGLAGYLLLSRAGPLGRFGLLYTPGAMVLVQAVLTSPSSSRSSIGRRRSNGASTAMRSRSPARRVCRSSRICCCSGGGKC